MEVKIESHLKRWWTLSYPTYISCMSPILWQLTLLQRPHVSFIWFISWFVNSSSLSKTLLQIWQKKTGSKMEHCASSNSTAGAGSGNWSPNAFNSAFVLIFLILFHFLKEYGKYLLLRWFYKLGNDFTVFIVTHKHSNPLFCYGWAPHIQIPQKIKGLKLLRF